MSFFTSFCDLPQKEHCRLPCPSSRLRSTPLPRARLRWGGPSHHCPRCLGFDDSNPRPSTGQPPHHASHLGQQAEKSLFSLGASPPASRSALARPPMGRAAHGYFLLSPEVSFRGWITSSMIPYSCASAADRKRSRSVS